MISMKTSKEGIALIHKYESFRNNVYECPAGVPTIGWGSTYYEDGSKVSLSDEPISRKRADELFKNILSKFEKKVSKLVNVPLDQPQFDSLVSLIYNIGESNFKRSTLLKKINKDSYDRSIESEFKRWNKGRVKGKLVVMKGLTRRRNEEAYLYFKCIR